MERYRELRINQLKNLRKTKFYFVAGYIGVNNLKETELGLKLLDEDVKMVKIKKGYLKYLLGMDSLSISGKVCLLVFNADKLSKDFVIKIEKILKEYKVLLYYVKMEKSFSTIKSLENKLNFVSSLEEGGKDLVRLMHRTYFNQVSVLKRTQINLLKKIKYIKENANVESIN